MQLKEREATWLLTILFTSKILFAGIGRFVAGAGTAGWLESIWCTLLALAIFWITSHLYRPFDGLDLISVAHRALGRAGRVAVALLLCAALIFHTALMLRIYADTLSALTLFHSPLFFILLFLGAAVAAGAFAGIAALARYCMIAGVVLGALLVLLFALSVPRFSPGNLFPLLGNGVSGILASPDALEVFSDIALLFLMTPHLPRGSFRRVGGKALLRSGAVITVFVLTYLLCVPYPAAGQFKLPMLEIAGAVNADVVFQRAEGIFLVVWIFSGFLTLSITFYFALYSFARAVKLSDRRAVTAAFLAIAATVALMLGTHIDYGQVYQLFFLGYTAAALVLPAALAAIARLRAGKELT